LFGLSVYFKVEIRNLIKKDFKKELKKACKAIGQPSMSNGQDSLLLNKMKLNPKRN
jgi:hypothetical protein